MEALPWVHLKPHEQIRVISGMVTKVLCRHRRFEEETSENEAAAAEEEGEEEGEEDVFAEKPLPDMDACPALKVGGAGEMGGAVLRKQPHPCAG